MYRTCSLIVLLLSLLEAAPVRAAVVGVCPGGVEVTLVHVRRQELTADGGGILLAVADDAGQLPGECETTEVAAPAAAMRWISLFDAGAPEDLASLTLIGNFAGQAWQLSEVITPPRPSSAPGTPTPAPVVPLMPYAEDILPYLMSQTFGSEERASMGDDGTLTCAAGTAPAGVVLHATRRWLGRTPMELVLRLDGSGRFDLGVADLADQQLETPRLLRQIDLPADAPDGMLRIPLPDHEENWVSLTLLCPTAAARVTLHELRLEPREAPLVHHRAAWLWQPALWRDTPDEALRIARRESLQRVYITVPVTAARAVADAEILARFVGRMRDAGTDVWAVLGDPYDVMEENRRMLRRRAEAYLAYNADNPQARLGGLQLDIEPYLIPGFDQFDATWRARYLATVTEVQRTLGNGLALDLVVPVWWGDHPLWGAPLFDALRHAQLGLTVMNYRTQPGPLRTGAQPFLDWGRDSGVPITIALELGSVGGDQTRLNFARSSGEGSLWLLDVGEQRLLVLLDTPMTLDTGRGYRETARGVVPSGNVSFAGDHERLWQLLEVLQAEWSAWSSFGGVAIHGFDELYTTDRD